MDHEKGRSLVWVLGQMRAMLEAQALERIEAKLNELSAYAEARGHGYTQSDRQARLPH
jgi:hypothetical protein